ncbi:MAG TPA: squalene synthase HpnC [Burkholderiaceae bacterium]|nr:squalene synthase HpnC [Burkholderiaceae bacterium]
MGIDHYENFPVASWLAPPRLRAPIREIYRFARYADDIADEGDAPAVERLAALAALRQDLNQIESGAYSPKARWSALASAVRAHALPVDALRDLLWAFEQDVRGKVYRNYEELLAYCRYSANPVGRLLLALYRRQEPQLAQWSDAICTGLQLVNFWQDVGRDHAKGRLYVPQSEFERFGVDESQIAQGRPNEAWRKMLAAQTQTARDFLMRGRPLAQALGGRIGWELRMIVEGGLRIAERIDAVEGDVFHRRPVLRAPDWVLLIARASIKS